jgi:hypothetical protein
VVADFVVAEDFVEVDLVADLGAEDFVEVLDLLEADIVAVVGLLEELELQE